MSPNNIIPYILAILFLDVLVFTYFSNFGT